MKKHFQYLWYILRHKWFVFIAGLKTGAPLYRLIIHDASKFLPSEWVPYTEHFYGTKIHHNHDVVGDYCAGCKWAKLRKANFMAAWKKHWLRNDHHWNHWVGDNGIAADMPDYVVREMVADWMGAGRAINGKWDVADWYLQNRAKIKLSPATRRMVEGLLTDILIEEIVKCTSHS